MMCDNTKGLTLVGKNGPIIHGVVLLYTGCMYCGKTSKESVVCDLYTPVGNVRLYVHVHIPYCTWYVLFYNMYSSITRAGLQLYRSETRTIWYCNVCHF